MHPDSTRASSRNRPTASLPEGGENITPCRDTVPTLASSTMKVLATLLLLLQLGPLLGPVLCHAQPMCGMPHPAAVSAPGGGDAGMAHGDCSTIQVCSPSVLAVLPAVARVEPALYQHPFLLPQGHLLLAGTRAAPLPPPPRA